MDVSGNDILFEDDVEVVQEQEDVSGNFIPNIQSDEDYLDYVQETLAMENSTDYSSSLANIENLLKFQIAVIIGFLLLVGFIVGWKRG